jgi:hypothetical protein
MRKFVSKLMDAPTAVAIFVLTAVVVIEGERLNHTLDGLDDTFGQHYSKVDRFSGVDRFQGR